MFLLCLNSVTKFQFFTSTTTQIFMTCNYGSVHCQLTYQFHFRMNCLKEFTKCMFCVCCCEKWCERKIGDFKDKMRRNAQSLYFIFFNIVILTFDVSSDIMTAWRFWHKGRTKQGPARYTTYSILTMVFTFLPFFVSLFTTCISISWGNKKEVMEQGKKLDNHIHECLKEKPWLSTYLKFVDMIPNCIYHLPFFQTWAMINYFLKLFILQKSTKSLVQEHKEFTKKVLSQSNSSNKKHEKIENVAELETRASKYYVSTMYLEYIVGKASSFKLSETFLEGGPQSVLQLYIVFKEQEEEVTPLQILTICTSFLGFAFGAMCTYLTHPTKTFPKKETSIWQRMFVFWLMVFQALPRIVTLSLTLFFMDLYVFGYSLTVLGPMILILLVVIIPFYKINPQKAFVGAIASLFAPCIVLDDFSKFLLTTSTITSVLYAFLSALNLLIIFCNNENVSKFCFMINPVIDTTNGEPLQAHSFLSILMIFFSPFSIAAGIILHRFLSPISRLKISNWLCSDEPFWNSEHILWLPFVRQVLNEPEEFENIDHQAEKTLGLTLLEFSVLTGKLQLTQFLLDQCNAKMDKSAFQKACHGGHAQIVSLMVSIARSRKDLESAGCEHWKNWLFQDNHFAAEAMNKVTNKMDKDSKEFNLGEYLLCLKRQECDEVIEQQPQNNISIWVNSLLDIIAQPISSRTGNSFEPNFDIALEATTNIFNLQWTDDDRFDQAMLCVHLDMKSNFEVLLLRQKSLTLNDQIKIEDLPPIYQAVFLQAFCKASGSSLHIAVSNGDFKKVKSLTAAVPIDGTIHHNKYTSFHIAAIRGHLEIAKYILAKNFDSLLITNFNENKTPNQTALHMASMHCQYEMVCFLVDQGANIEAKDAKGFTSLGVASYYGHHKIMEFLLNKGANIECKALENIYAPNIIWSAKNGHLEAVKCLVENGADVNKTDDLNQTALYWAAAEGYKEIVKYLLSTKCDINIKSDLTGRSALHFCAERGDENLVSILLDQGADPACQDNECESPLTLAALNNHKKSAMIILARQANLEITDDIESLLVTYFSCKNSDQLLKMNN